MKRYDMVTEGLSDPAEAVSSDNGEWMDALDVIKMVSDIREALSNGTSVEEVLKVHEL